MHWYVKFTSSSLNLKSGCFPISSDQAKNPGFFLTWLSTGWHTSKIKTNFFIEICKNPTFPLYFTPCTNKKWWKSIKHYSSVLQYDPLDTCNRLWRKNVLKKVALLERKTLVLIECETDFVVTFIFLYLHELIGFKWKLNRCYDIQLYLIGSFYLK